MAGANSTRQRMGRGGARDDQDTPVASVAEMVEIIWQLPGTSTFRSNSAKMLVRYLGGDETLVDEIRRNRAAQERLAASNPSHPARLFGEAVEAGARAAPPPEPPDERAQRIRRMRLENDELEARTLTSVMHALTDAGQEVDDAQRWLFRDRMSNLLRGEAAEPEQQTTHTSAFLTDVKGLSAGHVAKLRSRFGAIAARIKRERLGLPPNAELPSGLKNVDGHPAQVKIYRVPDELGILEEAYEELTETELYRATVAPGQRRRPTQQRLSFGRG